MSASKPKPLQELREQNRLTEHEVCRRAGVSLDALRRWEAGLREIDLGKLRPLADAFGVSSDQIQLEPYRRHHSNQGYRFVLVAQGSASRGYRAKIGLHDYNDARVWAQRPFDPKYPDSDSPMILQNDLEGTGSTADEALDDLAARLDAVLNRAFHPDRLPDDPPDWEPWPKPDWFGR